MFLRHKRIGKYTYVYLVESLYEGGRTRQHIIRNLGRREDVEARGDLERLAASAAASIKENPRSKEAAGRSEHEALMARSSMKNSGSKQTIGQSGHEASVHNSNDDLDTFVQALVAGASSLR